MADGRRSTLRYCLRDALHGEIGADAVVTLGFAHLLDLVAGIGECAVLATYPDP